MPHMWLPEDGDSEIRDMCDKGVGGEGLAPSTKAHLTMSEWGFTLPYILFTLRDMSCCNTLPNRACFLALGLV